MPTQLAKVDVMNMALDILEEDVLTSPGDDRQVARLLDRNYDPTRDELLRLHPWNFALGLAALAEDGTTPAFGWGKRYKLPTDCLRLLPVQKDGKFNGAPVPHEVVGSYVHTDATAPLKIRYTKRVENPGEFDPLFARALSGRMAWYVAHAITHKQSYSDRAGNIYQTVLDEAKLIDGLEGTPEDTLSDEWIDGRAEPWNG